VCELIELGAGRMAVGRGVESEDLYRLKSVVNPQISPDGQSFVYVQTTIDKETDEYQSHLFHQRLDKHEQTAQWTFGKGRNHSPQWSPDGKELAFVSNRSGKNQIYLLRVQGGEARQLTFLPSGASNPVWSPDGNKIAFSTTIKPDQSLSDMVDETKQEKPVPLVVTKMRYKSDAGGFWKGDFKQVVLVDVKNGELVQMTDDEHNVSLYGWSPDGKYLTVGADFSEDGDASFIYDVYLLDADTKELTKVTDSTGYFGQASWSPDGNYLGMLGHKREYENATHAKIWLYSLQSKEITCITADWEVTGGDYMIGDFHQGAVTPGLLWKYDSRGFYFIGSTLGNTNIYYSNLSGEIQTVFVGEQHVYGLAVHTESQQAIAAISKPTEVGDLYLLDLTGEGSLEKRTHVNDEFLIDIRLSQAEPIQFEGAEGWPVHGWIMKPVGFKKGEKYPLIVEIHGGPHAMYGNTYMNEFQILTAKGYAVLFINPRGSHGYGQEFVNAVRGDYGGGDYQDVMLAVDYALKTYDFIDDTRLGVTGGSYGGFMTNWIVGHTNRFKAAVTQRSISNWISFYGVSDIGYYFTEWQIDGDFRDIQKLWKHSPLAYVEHVETPLLILHSEKDYRCPIEQAEQLFIALRRLGKKTKFVRFPEENHELSRSGKPSLRKSRLDYIAEWFDENL
jgi:dipeptidyl aminopeptidase/acylaminoacyl peptidase